MAIFISGKSTCRICGQVLLQDQEKVGFTHFLPKSHKWWEYSDGVFHRACFESWPDHEEFNKLYKRFREIWDSRPKDLTSMEEKDKWMREAFKEFGE
jgi:hypothetical protein